tara:strand:+ start:21 stop:272 length:252 start_codon:yes stop_codon:yes gene_type:complete
LFKKKCVKNYERGQRNVNDSWTNNEIQILKIYNKYFPECDECWEVMDHIKSYNPNRACNFDADCLPGMYCNIYGYCESRLNLR